MDETEKKELSKLVFYQKAQFYFTFLLSLSIAMFVFFSAITAFQKIILIIARWKI